MKKFAMASTAAGLGIILAAGFAPAQTNDPGVQKRMEIQERRIDQGVSSGQLTPRETGRLEAEQARIRQTEERMKADGQLTPAERARLHNLQDNAGKRIYRQKHDGQSVNVGRPAPNVKDPGVQKRLQNQEKRIEQGVESGQLTPGEAGRLEANQARIRQTEERMKADGQLTPAERARLHNLQDNAGKRIYRQKHDRQQANTK